MTPGARTEPRIEPHSVRWLFVCLVFALAWLSPALASAQSCVAGNPIGSFPFTPGVANFFEPGASRVTNATFNGVAGDVLSFQGNPGGASSQIQLVRAANNATIIATVTFSASTTYTVTAADVAQFPYQMRITNNTAVNQTYVINCTAGVTQPAPTVTAINPASGTTAGGTAVAISGTNFTGATAVNIGGVAASFTVVNATTINATTPAHAAGAVNVAVTTPGGTGTGTGLFTYVAPPAAPTVAAINPLSGPTAGGTSVTITGTNFTGASSVTIGGVAATNVTVVSATSITATTPAHAAGLVDVVVTAPGGVGTGAGLFTYVAPPGAPSVTAVNPVRGVTTGGATITITGANFTGVTGVTIGGNAATAFTVVNATTITATTPAHAAGIVDIVVTTPNGSGTGTGLFTYVAPQAPTVTAINPASGPTAGGTSVTITGTTFIGATSVTIGGTTASFAVVNATTINATTPAHAAGAVDVVVTTPGGTGTGAGLFTYVAPPGAPSIASANPSSGPTAGGTLIAISGANLTGATVVTIGGVAASAFTVLSDTTISATTPPHAAGLVDITVTTPNGSGTGSGVFTYVAPLAAPTVTAIVPASGSTAGGTPVTITGANFTGASAVTIGGVAATAITVVNDTTITAATPAHAAGAVDVTVTTPNGSGSGAGMFTYVAPPAAPTVAAISPASGVAAGGTAVTITGANFTGATTVTIGGVAATAITVVNDTTITATTPAHAAGAADVVVTTPNGSGAGTGLFTYIALPAAPSVASVNPASGPVAGGTVVTIVGANFTGATAVTVGGVNVLGFTVASDTTLTATTAAHDTGVVDVSVTTPNGTGVGAGLFTYVAPAPTPARAVETIAGYLGRRNLLLAASEPDSNREIERLLGAARSGEHSASMVENGALGRPDRMSLSPTLSAPHAGNDQIGFRAGRDIGPPQVGEGWSDASNWQFAVSLSELSRHSADDQARRAAEAGYRFGAAGSGGRSNPFDVWIEGTYADFSDDGFGSDADGHFGLVSLGADYVVNSRLLVGAMAQYDTMSERSGADAREVEGLGWMVGPYATMRFGDGVFWRVRAAWGQSNNDVRPFMTYTDHFDSERWLISSRLTGNLEAGRWTVRPSASIFYMEDNAQSYVDNDGLTVPEVRSRFGQIAAGPEVSYRYQLNDVQLEPRIALSVATTFANDAEASGFGQIDGAIVGRDDVRARAELGLRATTRQGLALDISGAYDGIGSDGLEAYSVRITLRVPTR